MTLGDVLERAEHVFGDRVGLVDEPDQPAESWGAITYRELARRARAFAAGLDALGLAKGDRVVIVSHNSARFLAALYGARMSGRVLVPVNFRLHAHEIAYIVEHSGARVLLVERGRARRPSPAIPGRATLRGDHAGGSCVLRANPMLLFAKRPPPRTRFP